MSINTTTHLSGMAAAIRSCQSSTSSSASTAAATSASTTTTAAVAAETFDLANMSLSSIEHTIRDAFGGTDALWDAPIRLTFITGAGKLARQKYDPKTALTITSILRNECGYSEDAGASAIPECAGTFKLQHDTGKNLKTVIVFPKLIVSSSSTVNNVNNNNNTSNNEAMLESSLLLDTSSPGYKLATAVMKTSTWNDMIRTKCSTWSQKKAAIDVLETLYMPQMEQIEQQLQQGQVLTSPLHQQMMNDHTISSTTELQEKIHYLREQMQQHVEMGNITPIEHQQLLQQVSNKRNELQQNLLHESNSSKKKQLERIMERQKKLQSLQLLGTLPPLQYHAKITSLRKELIPLNKLHASIQKTNNRLLSLSESQQVAQREEILQQIHHYEQASRSWFESNELFQQRLNISRGKNNNTTTTIHRSSNVNDTLHNHKANNSSFSAASSSSLLPSNPTTIASANIKTTSVATNTGAATTPPSWVTPTTSTHSTNKNASSAKQKGLKSSRTTARGGGVFAAMMMHSDDDDDG
jgi:hypothetical protein